VSGRSCLGQSDFMEATMALAAQGEDNFARNELLSFCLNIGDRETKVNDIVASKDCSGCGTLQ